MGKVSKELNIKKAKYKCMVRGCQNTADVYSISRTREMGHTVLICTECAGLVVKSIEKFKAEYVEPAKVEKQSPFYHADSPAPDKLREEPPAIETEPEKHICQYCGRECNGKMGLLRHEGACKNKKELE